MTTAPTASTSLYNNTVHSPAMLSWICVVTNRAVQSGVGEELRAPVGSLGGPQGPLSTGLARRQPVPPHRAVGVRQTRGADSSPAAPRRQQLRCSSSSRRAGSTGHGEINGQREGRWERESERERGRGGEREREEESDILFAVFSSYSHAKIVPHLQFFSKTIRVTQVRSHLILMSFECIRALKS